MERFVILQKFNFKGGLKSTLILFICICTIICTSTVNLFADSQTVFITGEDLYNLLSTGTWECLVTDDSTVVQIDSSNMSVLDDGSFCVNFASNLTGEFVGSQSISFNTLMSYSGVTRVRLLIASAFNFNVMGSTAVWGDGYNYVGGIVGSDVVAFENTTDNYDTQWIDIVLKGTSTSQTSTVQLNTLECNPDSVDMSEIYCTTSVDTNLSDATFTYITYATAIKGIEVTFDENSSGGGSSDGGTYEDLINQIAIGNALADEYYQTVTTPTEEDNSKVDDLNQKFEDTQQIVDDYNQVMDNVDKPLADDVINDDTVDDVLNDEDVAEGLEILGEILNTFQSVKWIITFLLITLVIGLIKYILFGKG